MNLKRGIIKIDDFKDDPVILWFWRSRTDDAKADSLLKKIALPRNFYLAGVLRWEAREARDHSDKFNKILLAIHFDSTAIENFLSLLSLGISAKNLKFLKVVFSISFLSDFRNQIFLLANFFVLIIRALIFTGLVFVIIKFFRHFLLFGHRLNPIPHNYFLIYIFPLVLLAPILVFRNPYLIFIIYSLLLILILNPGEKNWLRLILLLAILLSIIIPWRDFEEFLKGQSELYQLYKIVNFDTSQKINPTAKAGKEIYAYGLKKQGNLDGALSYYEDLYYNQRMNSIGIINNLANLYFLYDEDDKAEELYRKVLHYERGEPYFNLGLVKLKKLEYLSAGEYMEEARKRGFSALSKEPIDIRPDNKEFYSLLNLKGIKFSGLLKPFYLLTFAIIFLISFLPLKLEPPYYCSICGKPVCRNCLESLGEETIYCKDCFNKLKSTKNPEIEEELRDSLSRSKKFREKFLSTIFNIIIPGAGLIYKNRNFPGLFIIFAAAACYLPIFFKNQFIKPAGWISLSLTPVILGVSAVILFFCYLFSFLLLKE